MKVKAFELRDRGTFIPAVAIKLEAENESERYLINRAGFNIYDFPYVLLGHIDGGTFHYDAYECGQNETMFTALPYIRENFDKLESGTVICTETIRGERIKPKQSERLDT